MPRPRKSGTKKRSAAKRASRKATPSSSAVALICPECGKEFTRAASLGAHRNRAHGVTGASARRTPSAKRGSTRAVRPPAGRMSEPHAVDRDALLQTLFPQGIPAKERIIRDLNAWLDQAERLARQS